MKKQIKTITFVISLLLISIESLAQCMSVHVNVINNTNISYQLNNYINLHGQWGAAPSSASANATTYIEGHSHNSAGHVGFTGEFKLSSGTNICYIYLNFPLSGKRSYQQVCSGNNFSFDFVSKGKSCLTNSPPSAPAKLNITIQ